ncbi:hypothetical protein NDU88_004855 [Pleurodeles waltl]|uniref:Uncharacterized protein n=1 Tax=Pleurodeles waltl TaxID=8319 RepID=A0AAV7UGF4_PLEWA|nr:hypothetical protein NDU88_004855 [Pleurodeles waltl]
MEPLLQLLLPLFPRRGIRAAPFRARRSSSAARRHQTAPAALQPASVSENRGAHIRVPEVAVRSAAPSCRAPQEPELETP